MRRLILIMCLFLTALAAASGVVLYQLEFLELNQEAVTKLNLKQFEANFPKDGTFFSFNYLSKEMELSVVLPFVRMNFEVGEKTEKRRTSTRPWLATVLNQKAVITIASEELSLLTDVRTGRGLRLEFTPIRVEDGAVLTKVSIADPYGPNRYESELSISDSDFSLIGFVTIKKEEGFQHVAVYAKASVISSLPERKVYSFASLDEMGDMFFDRNEGEPSEAYAALIYDGDFKGQVNVVVWTESGIVLKGTVSIPSMEFSAGLEKLVTSEGLRVGARISRGQETCLVLGFSDVSKLTNFLSMFASLYPIKISLQDATFKAPEWSFGVALRFDEVTITLQLLQENSMVLSGDVKFNFTKNFFAMLGTTYDFSTKKISFKLGFGVNF